MDLTRNGSSPYRIAVATSSRPVVANAAAVLQDYLARVTGVRLPIDRVDPGGTVPERSIVVGDLAFAVRVAPELAAPALGYDGLIVRAVDDRLVLTGAPERGPLYAVIDFLEREVGCRWFSTQRVVIPAEPDLVVSIEDRRDEPAFEIRMPWGVDMWHAASRTTFTPPDWGANPSRSDGNSHTFFLDAPAATFFRDHPKWFSYHSNNVWFHETGQLNYHNAELLAHIKKVKLSAFEGWARDLPNLNLCPNDCLGWSEDPAANAFDGPEDSVAASHVHFVNQVADAVAARFPDRRLVTLAYLQTHVPPKTLRYAPNVTLMICEPDALWGRAVTRSGALGRQYVETVRRWALKCDMPLVWLYHQFCVPKHVFSPDIAGLQGDFQAYRDAGARGFFAEIYSKRHNTTHFDELRPYLMSRLAWDPDLDLTELLCDFHLKYFGPNAGPKMLEFTHAVCDGLDSFDPGGLSDDRLDRMERLAAEARPLADDRFAARRIAEAQRAVVFTRMAKLIGHMTVRGGKLRNNADAPEASPLRRRFSELSAEIGDDEQVTLAAQRYGQPVVEKQNSDLKLTIVPASGATVARIIDLRTQRDYAFLFPVRSGKLVGGYQELLGFQWSCPGIFTPFSVERDTDRGLTLVSDEVKPGVRIRRTISLPESGPSFRVVSRVTNVSDKDVSRGFRTHPMFRLGDIEDCWFAYRTGDGRVVAKPAQALECLSAGWGPTGLWALVNSRLDTGILWESPPVHNGHYTWAAPFHNSFACETFSEHATLKPGASLELEQRFTILRDARRWCTLNGIPVPAAPDAGEGRTHVALRPLSKAEKWHRKHGLFFSGWLSVPDPDVLAHYHRLYPYAFTTMRGNADMREALEKLGMPWLELNERGPCFDRDNWRNGSVPQLPSAHEVGYCLDEDVLWKRDLPTGRVQQNVTRVLTANRIRPDALYVIGCHAWNRSYGSTRLAARIGPDVVAGEVYPFIHGNDRYSSFFWQLTWARDAARRTGKAHWNFIQTFGQPVVKKGHCRPPSPSEQRLQVFGALAWGYLGFVDYYYALPRDYYERGSVPFLERPDGTPTAAYGVQQALVREAMNLGRGLSQLRNVDVGFAADTPRLFRGLPVELASDPAPAVTVGRFTDDSGNDSYFMVTSTRAAKNLTAEQGTQDVTLIVRGNHQLIELDRMTGELVRHRPVQLGEAAGCRFRLPGGTGTLLKVDDGRPFALQPAVP